MEEKVLKKRSNGLRRAMWVIEFYNLRMKSPRLNEVYWNFKNKKERTRVSNLHTFYDDVNLQADLNLQEPVNTCKYQHGHLR